MVRLSVNINKIATLRNARGGNVPDVVKSAIDIERFGAQGITVHPRPDERHIRKNDVRELKKVLTSEFNIEGFPSEDFLQLIEEVRPEQATLVPDAPEVLTSNAGWDTIKHHDFLSDIISRIKSFNVRVSLFMAPEIRLIEQAKLTGTDRVELYTEDFARRYSSDKENGIAPYIAAALRAKELGMGINAGHDLSLVNLSYFTRHVPGLMEVSIGHALISDSLYFGLENTIQMYLREIKKGKQAEP